jgi:hypothetical protein
VLLNLYTVQPVCQVAMESSGDQMSPSQAGPLLSSAALTDLLLFWVGI